MYNDSSCKTFHSLVIRSIDWRRVETHSRKRKTTVVTFRALTFVRDFERLGIKRY